ncbi:MAG TPA: choice-of-anchor Q domain-containing protein [Verrucomicrobiales bacterium]|nr:choice-of-anchor Q domain-containing protein [Verrucomicrobiales bacterium]
MKKSPILVLPSAFLRLTAVFAFAGRAHSQIIVTTLADENDTPAGAQVSLREAIRDSANGGQITFDAALNGGPILLIRGEMAVTGKTLTVTAPGGGILIEGRVPSRIFRVDAGAGLNLTDFTLQGGVAPGDGGAILSAGTLTLTDCVLRENRAGNGTAGSGDAGSNGGAISHTGSLTASHCRFISNAAGKGGRGEPGINANPPFNGGMGDQGGAGGAGGAIFSSGTLSLSECVFESNLAGAGGPGGYPGLGQNPGQPGLGGGSGAGGAVSHTGDMTMTQCSFVRNACPSGGEPGINPQYNSLFWGHPGDGTAIAWNSGTATLTNCLLSGNGIDEKGSNYLGGDHGGVIYAGGGTRLQLIHCTVAGNVAGFASRTAGFLFKLPTSLKLDCQNCLIGGNWRNNAATGTPVWVETNFYSSPARTIMPYGYLSGTPGLPSVDPLLSPLSGLVPVVIPGSGSPALNTGAILTNPPATDVRGLPRAFGGPDLGAVEVQPGETPRAYQSLSFALPLDAFTATMALSATASSGLPVSYEVASGQATVAGNTLTFNAAGQVVVRAMQQGNAANAPAFPVLRVIRATAFVPPAPPHFITVSPLTHLVYPPGKTTITLPATTSANLPVTWSLVSGPFGTLVDENRLTVSSAGSVQIRGQNPGNAELPPVDFTWTLTFQPGRTWLDTPAAPGGGPLWFTFVEGSPHGLTMTAHVAAPDINPVPVPVLIPGMIATPAFIPVGETSIQSVLSLSANPQLTNQVAEASTGNSPNTTNITLFLANRNNVPLNVTAPPSVTGGVSVPVDIAIPGVPTSTLYGPPADLSQRTVTVRAVEFDNPAAPFPVTLDSTTIGTGLYPAKRLMVTFPPISRRVRLIVTTDDGISGTSDPVQIDEGNTNTDGDGINDLVEAALQRTPGQFHQPPLIVERDATGVRAILGNRPTILLGWTITIETSTDLQTWTAAPAASTTVTANPDGVTERVSVLLPADGEPHFVRLKAVKP